MHAQKDQTMAKKHLKERLLNCIDKFSSGRILVIGDIILDEYIWGEANRISPEAPIPVVSVTRKTKRLGGASNVANNIASLGASCFLCGVIGYDEYGKYIINKNNTLGISNEGVFIDSLRHTTVKTRVIAKGQQVVRYDQEVSRAINFTLSQKIAKYVASCINKIDAIIISDYAKGVITPQLIRSIKKIIGDSKVIVSIDPKPGNLKQYKGFNILTPNLHEASTMCGFPITDDVSFLQAGKKIFDKTKCDTLLITQGDEGMTLFKKGLIHFHIPAITNGKRAFDVSGAGDTVISVFTLALATGIDEMLSAKLSNLAAGTVVNTIGTSPITFKQIKEAITKDLNIIL